MSVKEEHRSFVRIFLGIVPTLHIDRFTSVKGERKQLADNKKAE